MNNKITKTDYLNYVKCPRLFVLGKKEAEADKTPPLVAEQFPEIRRLAEMCIGHGKSASPALSVEDMRDPKASFFREVCAETDIAKGTIDFAKKNETGWDIYMIAPSTMDKTKKCGGFKKNDDKIRGLAFYRYLLAKNGILNVKSHMIGFDKTYRRHGELDPYSLFVDIEVTELVELSFLDVEAKVEDAFALRKKGETPNLNFDACWRECPRLEECLAGVPEPSILRLHGMKWKDAVEHFKRGIKTFEEALNHHDEVFLNKDNTLKETAYREAKAKVDDEPTFVDKPAVASWLSQLQYPLYCFDFESYQSPLPLFDNSWAYEQMTFQYSVHVAKNLTEAPKHREFLAEDPKEDPRLALTEKLIEDLGDTGSVIVYNQSFEETHLLELAEIFPQYKDKLLAIVERLVDLEDVFAEGFVYDKAMEGRTSIKKVLPALFPDDPTLDYHALDGVHNGAEAPVVFLNMPESGPERKKTRENLLKYCGLDTLAELKILQWLSERSA